MADLASCYFCATPDDVQEFAVIPERFDPDDDEQRTVVLCESCHGKLGRVIEPLADRLDAALGSEPGREAAGAAGQPGSPSRADPGGQAGDDAGQGGTVGGGAPAEVDEGGITVEPPTDVTADERTAGPSASTSASASASDNAGDGITVEQGAGEEPGDGADGTGGTDGGPDEGGSDVAGGATPPRGYRKAMRLLENREFPLDRYEVEGLIAGAYDLNRGEVDDIIEAAVEAGRFVEDGGKLKRA